MNNKNKILVGCLALLLVLSVGYALFSDTITINGTATAKGDFDITTTCQAGIPTEFGTVESLGLEAEGGYNNDSCTVVDDTVSINVGLEYPGAKRYFFIKMTNEGTIDATLSLYDMEDKITGEFCYADNKEGSNAKCKEYKEFGYGMTLNESPMFDGVNIPIAFEDENGTLTMTDEAFYQTSSDYFDATNYVFTLKPNQTAIYLVTGYFAEWYTLGQFGNTGEFFVNRTFTLEFPWQQKTTN